MMCECKFSRGENWQFGARVIVEWRNAAVQLNPCNAETEQQNGMVGAWAFGYIPYRGGAAAASPARERERGRKGVRKRLPLRQMCAAKAADVDAYAAGWLTRSLRTSEGSFNHFISLFRTHMCSNATILVGCPTCNYRQLSAICIFIVCIKAP